MTRANRQLAELNRRIADLDRRTRPVSRTPPPIPTLPASAKSLTPSELAALRRTDARTLAALPASIRQQLRAASATPRAGQIVTPDQVRTLNENQRNGRYAGRAPVEVREPDQTGRPIIRFFGDARSFWAQFKHHR